MSDQETLPHSITEEDLIGAIAGRRPDVERSAALKEIVRRRSPRMGAVLSQVIVDPSAPLDLRTAAAVALGQEDVSEAEDALLAGLESDQPSLVARAAEGLGRIGDRKAYEALARRAVPSGERPARAIEFARTLIAYRLGLDMERLKSPASREIMNVDRQRAVEVRFDAVKPEEFRAAEPFLKRELPRIPVDERGSLRFSCRRERLWILISSAVAGPAAGKRIGEHSAVAAVVLKESTCPDGWYVYEYLMTHPVDERKAEIFGVRPTGEISHYGEAVLDEANVAVKLRAVNSARVLPLELAAEYRGRESVLEIREATAMNVPAANQKRPAVPRLENSGLR